MTIHKFGYSAESLQIDKMDQLQKDLESHKKLSNISFNDIRTDLENLIKENINGKNLEEIKFKNGETEILINAKYFIDLSKQLEDLEINLRFVEQDYKRLLDQRKEIISEALNFIKNHTHNLLKTNSLALKSDLGNEILNAEEVKKLKTTLSNCKQQTIKEVIQLLYDKGLFNSFENKDQVWVDFLTFTDEYLLEKYGTEITTQEGVYLLSDLKYSTRSQVVEALKKDKYKDIVDLKHRMKLTQHEINYILFQS